MQPRKKILVAPLNCGLGHATRCIPVIEALENHGYEPIIASDGFALSFLTAEFPHLTALTLPHYKIEYAKRGVFFKFNFFRLLPGMLRAIREEKRMVREIIKEHKISGVVSDNRLGVRSGNLPCVFITHQLNVLTGTTTFITTPIQRRFVAKYNECWVPDTIESPNLSGKMGHVSGGLERLKYIGSLSALCKKPAVRKYDLMVLISGTGTERARMEENVMNEVANFKGSVLFVRGLPEDKDERVIMGTITFCNFLKRDAMEQAINESEIILCRPGYSTIMDLAQIGKKAFFIPTPGLYEQEYLAKKFKKSGIAPYASQENFKLEDLKKLPNYTGLKKTTVDMKWKDLFSLFEGK